MNRLQINGKDRTVEGNLKLIDRHNHSYFINSKYLFLLFIFAISFISLLKTQSYFGNILRGWDAQFYYSTAHSIVFDHDLNITNDIELSPFRSAFTKTPLPRNDQNQVISKYPIGMSLVETPFLLCGHIFRVFCEKVGISLKQPRGYSNIEIWSVAIGLLMIFTLGMLQLRIILLRFWEHPWIDISIIFMWFGSSLFYYSSIFPFMTHAVAFTLILSFVYINSFKEITFKNLILSSLLLGFLFLLRPQQITIVLPFIPRYLTFLTRENLKKWLPKVFASFICFFTFVFFQAWVFSRSFGSWSVNAYSKGGEGFAWFHPNLYMVLLHPARGIFWISPIFLIAIIGYLLNIRKGIPFFGYVFFFQFLIQIYLVSAWSSPAQGDSFGGRMLVESAPVIATGLLLLGKRHNFRSNVFVCSISLPLILWTMYLMVHYISGNLILSDSYTRVITSIICN